MKKEKSNLQQFADCHGLQVDGGAIYGPDGIIWEVCGGWFYDQRGRGIRRFDPVTQDKQAIKRIGLQFTAPPKPIRIVEKPEGWYVEVGPFETPALARTARKSLKNDQHETPHKTT